MRTKCILLVTAVLLYTMTAALPVSAEWFAGVYLGRALTSSPDLTTTFGSTVRILNDVDFDSTFVVGGRGGYWFDRSIYRGVNFGLALDVFHFQPDIDLQTVSRTTPGATAISLVNLRPIDVSITAISFDLMLRRPLLPSREFPRGRLQPYLTLGPAIFVAEAKDSGNFAPAQQSDTDATVGVKLGVGAAWRLLANVAIFGEYRFTHFSPQWSFVDGGALGTLKTDINTHYLVFGASYRF